MDNKVAEKLQGGGREQETKWDALKSAKELTAEEIIARRERNFGKMQEKAEKSEKSEKAPDFKDVLKTVRQDPEWKVPKIETFATNQKEKAGSGMLVFPYAEGKLGAVPREKAVWSFMEYVDKAKTADDFRVANRIAGELEAQADITPEEKADIVSFRENPAYKYKETGFAVEGIAKRIENDKAVLAQTRQLYTEARKGGPIKRLMNRMKIKEAKARMEWTEKRLNEAQGDLKAKQAELSEYMKAAA